MNKNTSPLFKCTAYAFLVVAVVIAGFPLLYAFLGSFKSSVEFLAGDSGLLPKVWRWQNYVDAWNSANFGRYTFNSISFSLWTVLGTIATVTLSGYALSRSNFKIKKPLLVSFTVTMFVSSAFTLFPIFLLCKNLNLISSLYGMTLAQVAVSQPVFCIIVFNYIDGIPREIDEAAKIDGCSFFRIYWNIIMPVIKPIIATVSILSFRDAWNSFMMPLAFTLSKPELRPLTVGVVQMKDQGEGISAWNLMISGTVISLIPMMIVYLFMNRYFIAGIMDGSLKG